MKAKFENDEYDKIVKNVDMNSSLRFQNTFKAKAVSTDCNSYSIIIVFLCDIPFFNILVRTAQGQLIAILNMILVIAGVNNFPLSLSILRIIYF